MLPPPDRAPPQHQVVPALHDGGFLHHWLISCTFLISGPTLVLLVLSRYRFISVSPRSFEGSSSEGDRAYSRRTSLLFHGKTTDHGIKASKRDLHNKVKKTSLDEKGESKNLFNMCFGSSTPKIAAALFFANCSSFAFHSFCFFCLYLPCAVLFHFVSFRFSCFLCHQELVDVVFPSFFGLPTDLFALILMSRPGFQSTTLLVQRSMRRDAILIVILHFSLLCVSILQGVLHVIFGFFLCFFLMNSIHFFFRICLFLRLQHHCLVFV